MTGSWRINSQKFQLSSRLLSFFKMLLKGISRNSLIFGITAALFFGHVNGKPNRKLDRRDSVRMAIGLSTSQPEIQNPHQDLLADGSLAKGLVKQISPDELLIYQDAPPVVLLSRSKRFAPDRENEKDGMTRRSGRSRRNLSDSRSAGKIPICRTGGVGEQICVQEIGKKMVSISYFILFQLLEREILLCGLSSVMLYKYHEISRVKISSNSE